MEGSSVVSPWLPSEVRWLIRPTKMVWLAPPFTSSGGLSAEREDELRRLATAT